MKLFRVFKGLCASFALAPLMIGLSSAPVQAGTITKSCSDVTRITPAPTQSEIADSDYRWSLAVPINLATLECDVPWSEITAERTTLTASFNNFTPGELFFRSYDRTMYRPESLNLNFGEGIASETVKGIGVADPTRVIVNSSHNWIISAPGSYSYELIMDDGHAISYTFTFTPNASTQATNGYNGGLTAEGTMKWTDIKITGVDITAPTLVSMTKSNPTQSPTDSDTLEWEIKFSEDVTGVDKDDFALAGTTAALTVTGSGDTYKVKASGGDLAGLNDDVTLSFANTVTITDLAQNPPNFLVRPTTTNTYTLQNEAKVTNVAFQTADGHYNTGDKIVILVDFDSTVSVSGTPTIKLETGTNDRSATYVSGSGSTRLRFEYTVQAGDTAADLDYTATNALSGTLSGDGYTINLQLPEPGADGSLAKDGNIVIDTKAPTVTDVAISISGATGTNGVFKPGDTVTVSWDTSGTDGDTNLSGSLGNVTVDFSSFGGGSAVAATLNGSTWKATYLLSTASSTTGENLNASVTATDAAGNSTTTADTSNVTVNVDLPVITDGNISLSGATGLNGTFKIGDTVTATWDNTASGDNNGDIGSVTIDFSQFGGGTATATNTNGIWKAEFTIASGSIDAVNRNISVTATDTAGNQTTVTDNTNATVDNIAPTINASNVTISGATGNPNNSVFITGDDITVEWDNTLAGDNNSDAIDNVNVELGHVNGNIEAGANQTSGVYKALIQVRSGTTPESTYTVTIKVTDNAGNTSNLIATPINVDNSAPNTPAAPTLNAASNTGNQSDTVTSNTTPTISGTAEPGSTVTVFVGSTNAGTTTVAADGSWSFTFEDGDLAEGDNSITATATDTAGNTSTASTALTLTIDTGAPSTPVPVSFEETNKNSTASDETVSRQMPTIQAFALTSFAAINIPTVVPIGDQITNDPTPTIRGVADANNTVEVFVDGVSQGTTQADANGDWTFTFSPNSLVEGDNFITMIATDMAGNTSAASDGFIITLDITLPQIELDNPLMGDNLFNTDEASSVTISGTTLDVEDGQIVTLRISDNETSLEFTAPVVANSWKTIVDLSDLSDGELMITADVFDRAENAAAQASHLITKDVQRPTVTITGPTEIVSAAFDVAIVFSKGVTGLEIENVTVTNGAAIALSGSGKTFTATIDPVMGQTVQVSLAQAVAFDLAGNPNTASNVFEVQAGSPAAEFEKYREEIKRFLVDDASRSLASSINTSQRMVREARFRLVAQADASVNCDGQRDQNGSDGSDCDISSDQTANIPFETDGTLSLSSNSFRSNGRFFEQTGDNRKRIMFGDFDVQHDNENGSTTATVNARLAWEHMMAEKTLFGYFIGGSLARSKISGTFEGTSDKFNVDAGAYTVRQLGKKLYVDSFATIGMGQNNLNVANDTLTLDSDYRTKTASFGASLSGNIVGRWYELRPELGLMYGKAWIKDVNFTGQAYGLTDNTLNVDAGTVAMGNITYRTDIIVPLDGLLVSQSNKKLTFSPRVICEFIKTEATTRNCGRGAEIGFSGTSDDGLSRADIKFGMDVINSSKRFSIKLGLDHQF